MDKQDTVASAQPQRASDTLARNGIQDVVSLPVVQHKRKESELFTLAVVTYNQRHQLQACIESIAVQRYPAVELVIVDDCSCDFDTGDVRALVKACCGDRVSCKVIHLEEHRGAAQAYQTALEAAEGEYILFLGGDDRLNGPMTLNKMVSTMQERKVSFLQCRAVRKNFAQEVPVPEENCFRMLDTGLKYDILQDASTRVNDRYLCLQSLAMRRQALMQLGGFETRFEHAFDWALLFHVLFSDCKMSVLNETVTILLDAGAYHNHQVGCLYLEEGYTRETMQILGEYALPALNAFGRSDLVPQGQKIIHALEYRNLYLYHWNHFSARERSAWRKEHYKEIEAAKQSSEQKNGLFPRRWLMVLLAGMLLLNIVLVEAHIGGIEVIRDQWTPYVVDAMMIGLLGLVIFCPQQGKTFGAQLLRLLVCDVAMAVLLCKGLKMLTLQSLAAYMLLVVVVLTGVDAGFRIWCKIKQLRRRYAA